jgi:hypothetical protein
MGNFRRKVLLGIGAVGLVLLIATAAIWLGSRGGSHHFVLSTAERSAYFESSPADGLMMRMTHLTPTLSVRVTGMMMSPTGWVMVPGQDVRVRIANLADMPAATPGALAMSGPLSISKKTAEFHGFIWSSGFTARDAVLPGPFAAEQVDTFTVTYTTAFVLLIVMTLVGVYFGRPNNPVAMKGVCQNCGCFLPLGADKCPGCKTPVNTAV